MRSSLLLLVVLCASSCERPSAPPAPEAAAPVPPAAGSKGEVEASLPRVHDDNKSLLYYFLDERGAVKTVASTVEVPPAVRARVLVVDVSQSPEQRQAHRHSYFADLTSQDADGSYPVVVVSRYDAAKGEGPKSALPPVPEGTVIVYSAEWCGFCKKAKAWLGEQQVPFIERDVEKQAGASAELEEKLARANIRGGGVPVIDWSGTVVMGFDKKRLEKLLAEQRAGESPPGH